MAHQWYAIFMKDEYGVFCNVRHSPNDCSPGCEVIEVKKVPQELGYSQIEQRERELKRIHSLSNGPPRGKRRNKKRL